MTSVQHSPATDRAVPAAGPVAEPMAARLRRAAPLFVGAALLLLLLKPLGPLPLQGWVPVLIGASYLASGLLSRGGRLLGPGVVLLAWGAAPMTVLYAEDFPGMFYLCLGTGLLIAALLAQRGWFSITPMSLALPVLFIGGTMYLAQYADRALSAVLAALVAGWALVELRPQPVDANAR